MYGIIAELLGGIGVFFSGFYLLNTYLKQLTSRRLRLSIAGWTDKPWQGSILGVLFGALTQAPAALSFILAGLVSAGMIPVRRALPVTLWGNVGACLIVILVFLDINIAILFLLFFSGLCVAFERPRKMPQIPKALFGLGLLFVILGIHIGSSMINWILGSNLKGTPKQLVMGQAFFNVTGVGVMIILFCLEHYEIRYRPDSIGKIS